jgi:hypothetical protein
MLYALCPVLCAPQQRPDPRGELLDVEGLGEGVGGAQLQGADLVLGAGQGAEDQDGQVSRGRVGLEGLADGEAVQCGEAEDGEWWLSRNTRYVRFEARRRGRL